jgi:hypothetical protein
VAGLSMRVMRHTGRAAMYQANMAVFPTRTTV